MPKRRPQRRADPHRKTAICGTDIHIYNWDDWAQKTIPVPMEVGHEYCGEIVAMGSEVRGFAVGDRVSGEGHITCGHCRNCRAAAGTCAATPGRRREPPGLLRGVPGACRPRTCSSCRRPSPTRSRRSSTRSATPTHTALSFDVVGEDVLITGAGPIGIMAAAILRFIGARHVVVTDVNDYRLDLARRMGATRALNVTKREASTTR